jgi:hypothetical protein
VFFLLLALLGLAGIYGTVSQVTAAWEEISWTWKTSLPGGRIEDSSPTLTDLDDDGNLEVVIATTEDPEGSSATLAVLEQDGSLKWSREVKYPIRSSPAVADISSPADGIPEIIVTTGGDAGPPAEGSVVAFNNQGDQLWEYETNDAEGTGTPNGNWSSPTIGDLDNDGDMEIVFGSWDRNIYMLNHHGEYVWHYHVADTVWSTAALADLNDDGYLEVVIGTDIMGGGVLPDDYVPTDGGFVLILDKDGNKLARRQMNEAIFSSPAVGDVDRDGDLEIFVGTGMYYYKEGNYTQPYVYGFSVETSGQDWELHDLPGWPRPVAYPGMSSPALADLDGDKDLEVVIGTGHSGGSKPGECSGFESDQDCYGAIYAWQHDGAAVPGFPTWPRDAMEKNAFIRSSPTVGDVDGDGDIEILVSMLWDVIVVDEYGNQELVLHTMYSLFSSPAIGDLDGDGRTEVVVGGSDYRNDDNGYVYGFKLEPLGSNPHVRSWPMFHRDARNTGRYPMPPRLGGSPSSLYIMHQYGSGDTEQTQITIENLGSGTIDWTVTNLLNNVTMSSSQGTASSSTTVEVTVSASGYNNKGTYDLGDIRITGESDGETVEGSPLIIPVTLYVGEVHKSFLPLVSR